MPSKRGIVFVDHILSIGLPKCMHSCTGMIRYNPSHAGSEYCLVAFEPLLFSLLSCSLVSSYQQLIEFWKGISLDFKGAKLSKLLGKLLFQLDYTSESNNGYLSLLWNFWYHLFLPSLHLTRTPASDRQCETNTRHYWYHHECRNSTWKVDVATPELLMYWCPFTHLLGINLLAPGQIILSTRSKNIEIPISWFEDSNRDGKISQDEMAMALKALNPKISTETWHGIPLAGWFWLAAAAKHKENVILRMQAQNLTSNMLDTVAA